MLKIPIGNDTLNNMSRRFIVFQALNGSVYALIQLSSVIARKSLNASEFEVTILTIMMHLTAFTSIWWGWIIEGRDQRPFLLSAGLVGFLVVGSGIFLHSVDHLILIILVYCFATALFSPAQNRILQQHVSPQKQGIVFGISQGAMMAVGALISFLAGFWMDHHNYGYRHFFLTTAVLGTGGLLLFASIPPGQFMSRHRNKFRLLQPFVEAGRLLRRRKDFLRFEGAFMIYEFAYMMLLPVVPLYLVDDLQISYTTIGLARGTVSQIVTILAIILAGRLFDLSTPHRFAVYVFLILICHPLALIAALPTAGLIRDLMIYLAFVIWGFAVGGLLMSWNLSSIRFAADEDAGVYQSVHYAAVTLRGIIAPFAGYAAMMQFGKPITMAIISLLWLIAAAAMMLARYFDLKSGAAPSLRAE